jgi:hypothetical protein
VFEVGGVDAGDGVGEAADGVGEDVATGPPVLHPAIPTASTTSPPANRVRTALKVKRLNYRFGYAYMQIFGPLGLFPRGNQNFLPLIDQHAEEPDSTAGTLGWQRPSSRKGPGD